MLWLQIRECPTKNGLKNRGFFVCFSHYKSRDGWFQCCFRSRVRTESTSRLFSWPTPQDYKMAAAAPCMINLHLKAKKKEFFLLDLLSSERKKSFLETSSRYPLVSYEQSSVTCNEIQESKNPYFLVSTEWDKGSDSKEKTATLPTNRYALHISALLSPQAQNITTGLTVFLNWLFLLISLFLFMMPAILLHCSRDLRFTSDSFLSLIPITSQSLCLKVIHPFWESSISPLLWGLT